VASGRIARVALVGALAATVAACATGFTGGEVRSTTPRQPVALSEVREISGNVTAGGARVAGRLAASQSGNVAVAPSMLAIQLGMVRAGAATATATEIDGLFQPTEDPSAPTFGDRLGAVGATEPLLESRAGMQTSTDRRGAVEVDQAVALWLQRGTEVDRDYLETLARNFDTGVRTVDFRSDPETARQAINRWTQQATDGRTEQLVARGLIDAETQLVSSGAQWMSGPWLVPFDPEATRDAPFVTDTGRTVTAPTMRAVAGSGLRWAGGDGWQAVEMPYLGRELAMVAVRTDPGREGLITSELSGTFIDEVLSNLSPRPLDVALPRFSFTSTPALSVTLTDLGVASAFTTDLADFTTLAPSERLALTEVVQEVYLSVDETGSAARVATATQPTQRPQTVTSITFDRPFLVLVVDRSTSLPLVIARVGDPTQ
jgi:serpin B